MRATILQFRQPPRIPYDTQHQLKEKPLNLNHVAIASEGERNAGQHLFRELPGGGKVFPAGPAEMDEDHLFYRTIPQIGENFTRREMRHFADQQVERFLQQRFEIVRPAEIGAVADAASLRFQQEAKG